MKIFHELLTGQNTGINNIRVQLEIFPWNECTRFARSRWSRPWLRSMKISLRRWVLMWHISDLVRLLLLELNVNCNVIFSTYTGYTCFLWQGVSFAVLCSHWYSILISFRCKVLPCYKQQAAITETGGRWLFHLQYCRSIMKCTPNLICFHSAACFWAEGKCDDGSDVFLHKLWSIRTCAQIHMHASYSPSPEAKFNQMHTHEWASLNINKCFFQERLEIFNI